MPREFFKRYMPDEEKVKKHPHLSRLGTRIHDPNLWHLNRNSISRAFLVGVFCAFLPLPMQMLIAALLAIWIRSNLPLSVALVWISNPVTIPPIFYFTYKVGAAILGTSLDLDGVEFSIQWISQSLVYIWEPLLLGSLFCGLVFSTLSYFIVRWLWARHVWKTWKLRAEIRLKRALEEQTREKDQDNNED